MEHNVKDHVSDFFDEIKNEDILVEPTSKIFKKVFGGNELPKNIHVVPFDDISFHSEKIMAKWKFVFHRRIAS